MSTASHFSSAGRRAAISGTSTDNELIDYVGTWGPAILGHAPQAIIEAVHNAAKDGVSFGIPNPYEVRWPA